MILKRKKPKGQSKGQILVFEEVLLFTIGVVILIMSFAVFMMYQNYYISSSSQDQITEVKEYVLSNIIKMCEKKDINSSVVISVPKMIGNRFYKIRLSPIGLNVTMEDGNVYDFSPLYGLNESFEFSGMATSDLGKIVIYKSGNAVFLDRKIT